MRNPRPRPIPADGQARRDDYGHIQISCMRHAAHDGRETNMSPPKLQFANAISTVFADNFLESARPARSSQHQVPTDVAARPGATSIDGPATLREQHQVANDVPGPGPLTTAESQRCCKPPRCRSGVAVRGGKLSDRVVAQALLDRVKDRDALSDEPGGDLAQAVGPVQHVEVRALKPDRGLLHDLR